MGLQDRLKVGAELQQQQHQNGGAYEDTELPARWPRRSRCATGRASGGPTRTPS